MKDDRPTAEMAHSPIIAPVLRLKLHIDWQKRFANLKTAEDGSIDTID